MRLLTRLALQGNDENDTLSPLSKILRYPTCNLHYLRFVSCSSTIHQWADRSSSLEINQSHSWQPPSKWASRWGHQVAVHDFEIPNVLPAEVVIGNGHLIETCGKELSSTLILNQRLTHLCLAKKALGDSKVNLLCESLSYPQSKLQTLVLWRCT